MTQPAPPDHVTRRRPKRAYLSRPWQPTAAVRTRAIAKACSVAMRFAWAVSGRDALLIQQISDDLTRDELAALAIILAAAADGTRLLVVTKTAPEGGERVSEGDADAA